MLLDDLTPELFGELINECSSKHAGRASKAKGNDPIHVRAYVAFHGEHWRRRRLKRKPKLKLVPLQRERA